MLPTRLVPHMTPTSTVAQQHQHACCGLTCVFAAAIGHCRDKPRLISDGEKTTLLYNIACCHSQLEDARSGLVALAGRLSLCQVRLWLVPLGTGQPACRHAGVPGPFCSKPPYHTRPSLAKKSGSSLSNHHASTTCSKGVLRYSSCKKRRECTFCAMLRL